MNPETMTAGERRSAASLAGIYSLRMLGLFMILPVFALYAEGLAGVTPTLVGVAIGIYGLTQAVFQIPFGMLSDRLGRKPVITAGLLIFAAGSVVAAQSDTIHGVIAGRALQGAGAIAAAVMALAADLTREEHRLKVMAVIGMSIGVSFSAAMVLGPVLDNWIGVPGLFWMTAVLALGGIAVLQLAVPRPVRLRLHRDTEAVPAQFGRVLRDGQLLRLDFGIFTLHMVLTGLFVIIPVALRDVAGLAPMHHWYVYLPVMVLGFAAMVPFIIIAEKKRRMKRVFTGAVAMLAIACLSLWEFHDSLLGITTGLLIFFAAFNLLEASLPSLVAKLAPTYSKGTAMGVYSSSQFLGAFCGGAAGGWLHGRFGFDGVFLFLAGMVGIWLLLAATMRSPRYLSSYVVPVGTVTGPEAERLAARLTEVRGVAEATVLDDGMAYLKVDLHALDREALTEFAAG